MTNEKAIEIFSKVKELPCGWCYEGGDEFKQAINLAIRALQLVESQEAGCHNCVNRYRKSKEVCSSPFWECMFFDDETNSEKGGAKNG